MATETSDDALRGLLGFLEKATTGQEDMHELQRLVKVLAESEHGLGDHPQDWLKRLEGQQSIPLQLLFDMMRVLERAGYGVSTGF